MSETFGCDPKEFFQGKIFRDIDDIFLNYKTNNFQRRYHDRKSSYVNLKIDGWFTKKSNG